ncbi:low molecular weight phosphatase family protein [Mycobacterium sp. 236(2023)]|uniref:arsenate reductase/protein-tyrosine-phosphatase family protein n=1 Tax=Mycobacterium sp. 236(2023) TaxID=3038163 RepID=UPI0024150913|nr:low molecular weight phosphatase family protein [Mycobacterium sp. 236(2023)]MDG4664239.1 low molecular weight phosphatase family protein [Mycobacterium sp. 236(2023)]
MFVCTGNICRSPTAERLATAFAAELGIPDFRASSAGTRAVVNHPVHADAALVLQQLGGDPSGFAARQLTAKIAANADLIVAMTMGHRDRVLEMSPQKLNRTFTLAEASLLATKFGAETVADFAGLRPHMAAGELVDIVDPIGQSSDVFEAVGSQIADLVSPIISLCRPA